MEQVKLRYIKSYDRICESEQIKYACAMVFFNMPLLSVLQSAIDPSDLHEKGLETEPHVTALYGLHEEVDPNEALDIMEDAQPGSIALVGVTTFKNDEFEVLKFDASAEWLNAANAALRSLPFTNDYPEYHPHCTIAYLKPGMGDKYVEMFKGLMYNVSPSELVYSTADKNKTTRPANAS